MQLAGPGVFGPPRDPDAARAVLRRAIELGVDHIDTSQYYGPDVVNDLIRENQDSDLDSGFDTAMYIAGGLCVVGGVVGFLTVRKVVPVRTMARADVSIPCEPACVELSTREPAPAGGV